MSLQYSITTGSGLYINVGFCKKKKKQFFALTHNTCESNTSLYLIQSTAKVQRSHECFDKLNSNKRSGWDAPRCVDWRMIIGYVGYCASIDNNNMFYLYSEFQTEVNK